LHSIGSLQFGKCLESKVWWSLEKDDVNILIGPDDETWDVGINIPVELYKTIKSEYA